MNILFVAGKFPTFDRASAELRMFFILKLVVGLGHRCTYYVFDAKSQEEVLGKSEVSRYAAALEEVGVEIRRDVGFDAILECQRFDMVYFKYFYTAEDRIGLVRLWQPAARVVVDSVDLVYRRLSLKAQLTGKEQDRSDAEVTRTRELATYRAADAVVTVTDEESDFLHDEDPTIKTFCVPNIHEVIEVKRQESAAPSVTFVGVFSHEPNVDAVLYFARDVWPKIQSVFPNARWNIIGGSPPSEILAIASANVRVLGFVPDTLPYLSESWVSVAPLRFGAGMKGKVGEAMAVGVPVVTTSIGTQGCDLTSETHLMIGDTPELFAEQVIRLFKDPLLRQRLGLNGQSFVRSKYSPDEIGRSLGEIFGQLQILPVKKPKQLRIFQMAGRKSRRFLDRNLFWRINKNVG